MLALFRRDACSAGLAAELLGLTYGDFLDLLKERVVDYARGNDRDTAADEATLSWMDRQANSRKSI